MNSLHRFGKICVLDFEFQQEPGDLPVPHCCVVHEVKSAQTTRCWIARPSELPAGGLPYATDHNDTLWVTYFGSAEVHCLLTLGWPLPVNHLDLYAEFRCLTNGGKPPGNGLLDALAWFGGDPMDFREKEEMRQLAIRGGPFSEEERGALLDYCESDVMSTARLLELMRDHIDLPRALIRGQYVNAVGRMEFNGVPIDSATSSLLKERWPEIIPRLIEEVDAHFGVYEDGHFRNARWLQWVKSRGIVWPLHGTGAPKLDQDTFSEMSRIYPEIALMKELRRTLSQTRSYDLPIGKDHRNRALLSPFSSKTGRNQPKSSRFIFGFSKWMRGLIQPAPGKALAYLDYAQQEFGIAGALACDSAMQEAYRSGDPYLGFAKQAGAVPEDATPESHPYERELYKSCALGVQYGMGEEKLAFKIGQSKAHARQLIARHRRFYPDYWRWSEGVFNTALLTDSLTAAYGWRTAVTWEASVGFLRNFPLQANGAEMLRIACIMATEAGVKLCAPVHDALLIEADDAEIDDHVDRCRKAMVKASKVVLLDFEIRVDAEIIRYPNRFPCGNGQRVWEMVSTFLNRPAS